MSVYDKAIEYFKRLFLFTVIKIPNRKQQVSKHIGSVQTEMKLYDKAIESYKNSIADV